MNKTEIIIHGEKMDLFPDTVVGITYQRNDFNEVKTRQFTYSNDFDAPPTPRNIRLLGHANQMTSGSGVPYRYTDCAALSEGIQVTDNAIMQVVNSSNVFKLFITERSVPFWQAIEGQSVRDNYNLAALAYLSHTRKASDLAEYNSFTGDNPRIVYPIAYFGHGLTQDDDGRLLMDARYQYPALFVSDIVKNIIEDVGYTLESDLTENEEYKSLAILFLGEANFDRRDMLPDIPKRDFLKAIGFLMGKDFVQDPERTNTIITKDFDAPLSKEAKDWTGKLNWADKVTLERFWGEWAQNNKFIYKNDDYASLAGQGVLPFGNSSISKYYEAFKVPFSATLNYPEVHPALDGFIGIPKIRGVDENGDVEEEVDYNHTICRIKRANLPVRYVDEFNTTGIVHANFIPYAHFDDSLKIDNILNSKYKLLKSMFARPLKLIGSFLLTPQDISELDLEQTVYISETYRDKQINGYFIVSKVKNYVPGTFTDVELIEVGASVEATDDIPPPLPDQTGFLIDSSGNYAVDAEGNKILNDVQEI